MKQCPTCRKTPFKHVPNRAIRRAIGNMEVECSMCHVVIQRNNLRDHNDICPKREYMCAAADCHYRGLKEDFLKHLMDNHDKDLVHLCSGSQSNTFLSNIVDTQTMANAADIRNSAGRKAHISKYWGKFYCGGYLPVACGCGISSKTVGGYTVNFGCHSNKCGPDAGCNCPSCMTLDVQIRQLGKGSLVNQKGHVSKCDRFCVLPYRCRNIEPGKRCCRACTLLDAQVENPNALYYNVIH